MTPRESVAYYAGCLAITSVIADGEIKIPSKESENIIDNNNYINCYIDGIIDCLENFKRPVDKK